MQLPRGTFREIKKGIPVSVLLGELEKTGFSGVCSFSFEESTGTLVFKSGKGILSKFRNKNGDAAWDELQKILDEEVDAALSTLDEAQIQLSLEFNKSSRLVKWARGAPAKPPAPKPAHVPSGQTAAQPVRHIPSPAQVPHAVHARPAPAAPIAPQPERAPEVYPPPVPAQRPVIPPRPAPSARAPVTQPSAEHVPEKKTSVPDEPGEPAGSSSFENDIDTFDSMDLENVTAKIRSDCKSMIKQLNLEHLIDR